jgi:DNA-binding transcriptional ArsR family regulator
LFRRHKCIKLTFTNGILHILNLAVHKFKIEDRRGSVASMLARSMTESEIAEQLSVDQSTISRDIKALKQLSQRFVYDLAKSDLAYYYKQCLDGIEEVRRKSWKIFNRTNNQTPRDKLLALKLIMECNKAKFELFKEGPVIMQVKSMEERLQKIESREIHR